MAWPPNKRRVSEAPSMIRHEEISGWGNGLGAGFQADLARTSSITRRRITESLKMDFVPPMSLVHLSPSAPRRPIARSHTEHLVWPSAPIRNIVLVRVHAFIIPNLKRALPQPRMEEAWSSYLGYCERFLKDQACKQLATGGDSKITEFSNIGYGGGEGRPAIVSHWSALTRSLPFPAVKKLGQFPLSQSNNSQPPTGPEKQ
jgi:hypothetical protein